MTPQLGCPPHCRPRSVSPRSSIHSAPTRQLPGSTIRLPDYTNVGKQNRKRQGYPVTVTAQNNPVLDDKFPTFGQPDGKTSAVLPPPVQKPLFGHASSTVPLFSTHTPHADLSKFLQDPFVRCPPLSDQFSGYLAPPQVFDSTGNRLISLVRRSPQVNDYIVVPFGPTTNHQPHPTDWHALSACVLVVYVVAATAHSEVCVELPTLLVSSDAHPNPTLPPYLSLPGSASWFIGAPHGLSPQSGVESRDSEHRITRLFQRTRPSKR